MDASSLDDFYLDILGQQPLLRIYTQISLCYSVQDGLAHSRVVDTLTNGLERLSSSFPWVAGQVHGENISNGNTGIFKIKPLERVAGLIVKDYRNDHSVPSYESLKQSGFPMSMLDENLIAPRNTLPKPEEFNMDSPVFLVQANFIEGGLILTFNGQHQAMDMTGQGQVISLLSKACNNVAFTASELETGNLARRNLVPHLDESYVPGAELLPQLVKPPKDGEPAPAPPPKSTWTSYLFSPSSLSALKAKATETLPAASSFISTDDALSAFIWQAIARARLPRIGSGATSTFARAVDARRYLSVPSTYTGLLQNMAYSTIKAEDLSKDPLGTVASKLRAAVDPKTSDVAYRTRALATHMYRSSDKTSINFTATIDTSTDIMLSSWAKLDCYDLDFGLGLGKPECVRRPQMVAYPGLLYLLPKARNGEIGLAICLSDGDLARLREDTEFAEYGKEVS
ncbi:hypothetical protein K431DRAFT_281132 [Polychaeton citri CBS 116435]|uniref:Trichothecene 3-O-acetyltransferase-like N-terminal domain-containing protein n=1 Tax=Polychaeton citri CBS 116435 TaxID=1314669 RepID=A0A9P4QHV3_9PEZI|nr:hypothetical protein K431DRAFT_281132 [Polychaeton citri CBS 116435]